MKKLFTLILTIILLTVGCAKVEDMYVRNANLNGTEIVFNTHNSVTKAIVEGTSMVDTMGVYGYVVPGDYSANGGYLMKNGQYDENGEAVDGPYYWPKSDNHTGIDFIFTAYSQYVTAPTWENDTLKLAIPALTQALIDDPDNFNDVLWAQTQYNHHQNSVAEHERVILEFKHALSWLQFRGEVINSNVKWVKVKQIAFGEYRDSIPGNPGQEYIAPYNDTTDTWINLKRTTNVIGSGCEIKGPGESSYTSQDIPAALLAEIKSYYAVDGRDPGDYSLNLSAGTGSPKRNYDWDPDNGYPNIIKKLRVIKDIPEEYKIKVTMYGTDTVMEFFNGWKYLQDNGYYTQPASNGGKPAVWDYILLDAYGKTEDNVYKYTVVGLNWGGDSNSKPQYTIVENPGQEYIAPTPGTPACGSEGLYVDGLLCLPTKDTITLTPTATYSTQKDTTLNYVKAQVDTIFTNDHIILGNALVIPQAVPQNITIVFDICIANPNGDEVIFTDRKITRTINTGKDADKDADYTASWAASNKYIYNFRFDGDILNFTTSILGWTVNGANEYHVWDYTD